MQGVRKEREREKERGGRKEKEEGGLDWLSVHAVSSFSLRCCLFALFLMFPSLQMPFCVPSRAPSKIFFSSKLTETAVGSQ